MLQDDFAFRGVIEFDLKIELLGRRVARRARLIYAHTPGWPWYHVKTKKERWGLWDNAVLLELLSDPNAEGTQQFTTPGVVALPSWESANDLLTSGILTREVWDEIDSLIDREARLKDAENRARAHQPRRRRHKLSQAANAP